MTQPGDEEADLRHWLIDYLVTNVEDAARPSNRDQTPQLLPKAPGDAMNIILR